MCRPRFAGDTQCELTLSENSRVCSLKLLKSATILKPPSTGLSGILFYGKTHLTYYLHPPI